MKFPVLLYTGFIVQCMSIKASDAASYLDEAVTFYTWGAHVKRFFIVFFIISCVVLYFAPGSRTYARRGCYIMIDIVASSLKSAISGSFGYVACSGVSRSSYSSNRFVSFPEIQHTIATNGDAQAERYTGSAHASRRRRKAKHDLKLEDEKTRGHDRRRHRHEKTSQPLGQFTQRHKLQPVPRTDPIQAEIGSQFSPQFQIDADRTSNEFYYPGERKADPSSAYVTHGPQYSTSFVISGAKTGSSDAVEMEPDLKQGSVATLEEEHYPRTVNKQRGIPSCRSKPENTLYPENEGPTRDCDIFGLGELDSKWNCDGESKTGFGTTTLEYPEREFDASDLQRYRLGRENVAKNVQDCKDGVEDWEDDARPRILNKGASAMYEELDDNDEECRARVSLPPAEGNLVSRIQDAARKNERVKDQKKAVDDQDQSEILKNEEVLGQLGDQITKLEKSIRMMRPEVKNKMRASSVGNDYVLQNIESLLKEMKRSFDKVGHFQRRSAVMKEDYSFEDDAHAASLTSVTERSTFRGEVIEKEKFVGQLDLTILRSETLLEDQEELAPILTNRVKPYLTRTFDWLFTGCPGISGKKHGVGKEGAGQAAATRVP